MKTNIYTIFDSKAEAYLPPILLPNDGLFIRTLKNCMNDDNHDFSKHTADYTAFKLGTYCDKKAEFETHAPQLVGTLLELNLTESNNG
jgi:hypothetical protein